MSINTMIDQIHEKSFAEAGETFTELLNDKIVESLKQEKISIAAEVFNPVEEVEVEEEVEEEVESEDEE